MLGKKILIIGSLNMDMVIRMDVMPRTGETVLAESLSYVPGGKGANQSFAAGKLGGDVAMLGCVGEDSFGERLLKSVAGSGVDVSHIRKTEGVPTGTAVIYVNREGDNSIVVVKGANGTCDEEYLKAHDELIAEADYIMLQMEIPYSTVFWAIRRAHELGKTVILNPAPAPDPDEIPDDIWEKIDFITPNEAELLKLSGQKAMSGEVLVSGAHRLLERGVGHVLTTLGEDGAFFCDKKQELRFPARPVKAIDTTAAGDCFSGAFVTALAEGKDITRAIEMANVASSLAVTRRGAQSSIPGKSEVDSILGWSAAENKQERVPEESVCDFQDLPGNGQEEAV